MLIAFVSALAFYFIILSQVRLACRSLTVPQIHILRKAGWYVGLGILGLCVWDWWGWLRTGSVLLGAGVVLVVWKLPLEMARTFTGVTLNQARRGTWLVVVSLLLSVLVGEACVSWRFFTLLEKIQTGTSEVRLGAAARLLNLTRVFRSYTAEACTTLAYTARTASPIASIGDSDNPGVSAEIVRLLSARCGSSVPLDFRNIVLQGADLSKVMLSEAVFSGANLSGADFSAAALLKADFEKAILDGATFRRTRCDEARFVLVSAKKVAASSGRFRKAVFGWGTWEGSTLDGADLRESIIRGAPFRKVSLPRAVMNDVDGRGATFDESNLQGAVFKNADLRNARFIGADLRGADLTGAQLENADFRGADLREVKGLDPIRLKALRGDDPPSRPSFPPQK